MLLLIPVYVLVTIPMNMQKMATVVLGFVFLFAAALSIFTDARRLDVFLATATYSVSIYLFLHIRCSILNRALIFNRPSFVSSWVICNKARAPKSIEARLCHPYSPYTHELKKKEARYK
jgi:hypothetical protein